MPITALPTPPSRNDPANFKDRGDAFLGALPQFVSEVNALASDIQLANYLQALEIKSVKHSDYGATGNGTTVDTSAINAAFTAAGSAGSGVYVPPGTYLAPGLDTATCKFIYGAGAASVLKTTTDGAMLTVSSDGVTVRDIKFLGDGKGASADAGKTAQHGISINNHYRTMLINVLGEDLGGALFYSTLTVGSHQGNTVVGGAAKNCNIGIHCDERAEYWGVNGFVAETCWYGAVVAAGNFRGVGCNFSQCDTGIDLRTGDNDGHGSLAASQMNHCTTAINATDIENGFVFDDCLAITGAMVLTNSKGIQYINGQLDLDFYVFAGATGVRIANNLMKNQATNSISNNEGSPPAQSRVQWEGNYDLDGKQVPAGWIYSIRGGYARATLASDLTAYADSSETTVIYPTLAANYTSGNTAYTLDTFYSTSTGKATAKGYGGGEVRVRAAIIIDIAGASKSEVYIALRVNGATAAFLSVSVRSSLYAFSYDGIVRADPDDEIRFDVINNSGGNVTVKGGGDAFMEFEGL